MSQADDLTEAGLDELIAHRNGTCEQGGGACQHCETTLTLTETELRDYVAMQVARFRATLNKEYHDTRLNGALNHMEQHLANGLCKRGQ